ncbi:hypothetical protein HS048_22585 [Planomonospora sp. ID91781]|uniref:hypothetical protein n=1 Tax=Planomonospora sp. ID91781 TaxID=2738135 RepID=UPI0018C3F62A|nr:hypothetical protein [Planomonospora sp. ID91781]MBG0823521.1 hypothetical protein [Planomonospora sp. ID91781]
MSALLDGDRAGGSTGTRTSGVAGAGRGIAATVFRRREAVPPTGVGGTTCAAAAGTGGVTVVRYRESSSL